MVLPLQSTQQSLHSCTAALAQCNLHWHRTFTGRSFYSVLSRCHALLACPSLGRWVTTHRGSSYLSPYASSYVITGDIFDLSSSAASSTLVIILRNSLCSSDNVVLDVWYYITWHTHRIKAP